MFRTGNPMLKNRYFEDQLADMESDAAPPPPVQRDPTAMSVDGTIAKSGLLIGVCTAGAVGTWTAIQANPDNGWLVYGLPFGGMIVAFVLTLVCAFKPRLSPFTAMPVAVCEGLLAGGFSYLLTRFLPQNEAGEYVIANPEATIFGALLLTLAIAAVMLVGFATGIIRLNAFFKSVIMVATGGLMLFTLAAMGLGFFGVTGLLSVFDPSNATPLSIGVSVLFVGIAASNLILDFDTIQHGVRNGAPKYMEWFGAQSLLITLVWLYIEALRLVVKLMNRE